MADADVELLQVSSRRKRRRDGGIHRCGAAKTVAAETVIRYLIERYPRSNIDLSPGTRQDLWRHGILRGMRKASLLLCLLLPLTINAQQLSIDAMIDRDMASMLSTYKMLHAAPELSH